MLSKYQREQLAPICAKIWEMIEYQEKAILFAYERPETSEISKRSVSMWDSLIKESRKNYKWTFEFTKNQSCAEDLPF